MLISLQGCERKYHLKAHALEGYLHTPWGKFEFQEVKSAKQASEMRLNAWRRTWRGFLYADAGDVFVILPLNGQFTGFLGRKDSKYSRPTNYNLNIVASETKSLTKNGELIGQLLSQDLINHKGGGLGFGEYRGTGFKQQSGGGINTPYRIILPFNLSGDDFLVDVLVKRTKDGYWDLDIGVPGMP